jgi:hypothetical protein
MSPFLPLSAGTPAGLRMAALFALMWLAAGLAGWSSLGWDDLHPPDFRPGLDPNTAKWWQLSCLPEIGDGLAKDIVAHREKAGDAQPFRRAADLEDVPGIGPKTVQRIAKYLRFHEPKSGSQEMLSGQHGATRDHYRVHCLSGIE